MKELTVYLIGKMSGLTFEEMNTWRNDIAYDLKVKAGLADRKVNIINPVSYFNFEEKRYQSELEVMKFDLSKVKSSDIVIVNKA